MIQLTTLGATELRRDGVDVRSVLSQPKRLALLVYLRLAAPGGYVARERLMALFWPESDGERARNALRQSLHFLRRSLGDAAVVSRSDREVGIDPGAVACDALAFLDAVQQGRLEEAVDLYRGEFLSGFFLDDAPEVERWIEEQRLELARSATRASWSLSEAAEGRGERAAAVLWARRAVALDPTGEAGVRRLMELLARAGERARALEAFQELERRLDDGLDLEPSPETVQLAERIRSSAGPATPDSDDEEAAAATSAATPAATPEALDATAGAGSRTSTRPTGPAVDGPTWRRLYGRRAVAVAALALVAVAAVVAPRLRPSAPPALDGPPSIAVLPFLDMSEGGGNEYFSDGITEELLNVLARVPGLRVAARTSSFAFRGKDVTIDSIGRALDVTHVLEGSVRTGGDDIRITAQLIEAGSGFHIWSETYDRKMGDIFRVQDEIAAAIARRLQIELAGNFWNLSAGETRDPEAYRLLLRALQTFRTPSAERYATSAMLLQDAVTRDPGFARAWGALAYVTYWQAVMGTVPADAAYERADSLARLSLRLGETPEAHLALAGLAEHRAWSPDSADAHYQRALAMNPADVRTLSLRALFLARSGRGEEAVALGRRATEIDPLHPASWVNFSSVLSILGREDESLAMLEQARLVAPTDLIVLTNLANQYGNVGRLEEALATVDSALALSPGALNIMGLRVHLLFRADRREEAMAGLVDLAAREGFPRYTLATLYTNTGDLERILDLLELSAARREPELARLRAPDAFASIRHHPRIRKILDDLESGDD